MLAPTDGQIGAQSFCMPNPDGKRSHFSASLFALPITEIMLAHAKSRYYGRRFAGWVRRGGERRRLTMRPRQPAEKNSVRLLLVELAAGT